MEANKFNVTVGGKKLTVTSIDPSPSPVTDIPMTHHIMLIDRSGSMYNDINDLIDRAQEAVHSIRGSNDLLSILWYSGVGSKGVIVEAAFGTESLEKKLDAYRSVVGSTCFSEPLEEAATIARRHADKVDQTVITLFTDGCPVVPWSYQEELTRSLNSITGLDIDSNLVAVNTIGFGNYYRKDFLQALSDASEQGSFEHTRDIDDFGMIFAETVRTAQGLRPSKITIDANGDILYLGGDTRVSRHDTLWLSRLSSEENRIFVISDDEVFMNDKLVEAKKITQKEDSDRVTNFLYAYADALYYRGERQAALDIIVNNLRDKAIADKMINAFTIDEVSEAQDALRLADLSSSWRYRDGQCAPGYLPKKDAFCLIDMFAVFGGNGFVSYIPFSNNVKSYARINRKATDSYDVFTADKDIVKSPVTDFVWNKDLLNLSIQFSINGTVKINPRAAKAVGLDPEFRTKIFRNHTIVKDGQLNMTEAEFQVPNSLVQILEQKKVKFKVVATEYDTGFVNIVIDLRSMPIVNRVYIDEALDIDAVADYTIGILRAEASLKVLNNLHEKAVSANANFQKTDQFKSYTADQIQVLQEHGISKQGWYNGVSVERAKAEDSDSYEARTLSFYVKGASSLPSIADFEKMLDGKKTINVGGQMMIDFKSALIEDLKNFELGLDQPSKKLVAYLDAAIKETKDALYVMRNTINVVKLAKVLTNDFFHGLVPNDKGDYTYDKDGYTIVLRNDFKTIYI